MHFGLGLGIGRQLGVQIMGGGGVPALFEDTFDRADGAMGWPWTRTGANAAIASNGVVITPTLGAEVLTNGDFGSATGWTAQNGFVIAAGVATKSVSGATGLLYQATGAANTWYYGQVDVNATSGTTLNYRIDSASILPVLAAGAGQVVTERLVGTQLGFRASTGVTAELDNASFKPISLATCLATLTNGYADVDVSVELTGTARTWAGLVVSLDSADTPANFVLVHTNGVNLKLDKIVAGVWTNLINTAITYVAGAKIRVVKSGESYSAYYNNTQVGTTQTISDAGVISNTRHGLWSTYAGNTFDDFVLMPS